MSARAGAAGAAGQGSIPPRVALALAAALGSHTADTLGVRSLLIKGAGLEELGLRSQRTSSDVDLWIDPRRFDDVLGALAKRGWVERPRWRLSDAMTTHSVSLLHPGWSCDIDVHRSFPGFLAPPQHVFDVLWSRRMEVDRAGIRCAMPDRASSAAILALHSLRSSPTEPRHLNEYRDLVARLAHADDVVLVRQIADVAHATGSVGPLEPLLRAIGAEVPGFDTSDPAYREWIAHVNAGNNVTAVFAQRWARAPWVERPRMLALALWPSNAELRLAQPHRHLGFGALAWERCKRLVRNARSLPILVRARRRAKRGIVDSPYLRDDE